MDRYGRRKDQVTARLIEKALEMRRAFGPDAGSKFLTRRGIIEALARAALQGRYDRRRGERRNMVQRPAGAEN